jgi:hypothetical protein
MAHVNGDQAVSTTIGLCVCFMVFITLLCVTLDVMIGLFLRAQSKALKVFTKIPRKVRLSQIEFLSSFFSLPSCIPPDYISGILDDAYAPQ